jgi:hypothetical protein
MKIEEALKEAETWLDEIEGVQGVARGRAGEEDCITVFISLPEAAGKIPKQFHGFPVCTELTGPFHALG